MIQDYINENFNYLSKNQKEVFLNTMRRMANSCRHSVKSCIQMYEKVMQPPMTDIQKIILTKSINTFLKEKYKYKFKESR